jgi:plastocyanin
MANRNLIAAAAGAAFVAGILLAFGLNGLNPARAADGDKAAAKAMTPEQEKICQEAASRYKELFGRAPEDEEKPVVLMYRYAFCPRHLEVKTGTTIRWIDMDKRTSHSVWFKESGGKETERIFPEEDVELTMDFPPGEYPYICGPHGVQEKMTGTVTIIP